MSRLIADQVKIQVVYISHDKSIEAHILGYVSSWTEERGIAIVSEAPQEGVPMNTMFFAKVIEGSRFYYEDQSSFRDDTKQGSGLIIRLPLGDRVVLIEVERA